MFNTSLVNLPIEEKVNRKQEQVNKMSEQKPMNITKETKRIRGVRGNLLN